MVVRQGDLHWVDFGRPQGSEPGLRRPCVVVQNNVFNRSRIQTVMVCAVTARLGHATHPGNVLLEVGEGGLPQRSVVNVSQVATVDRSQLTDRIGTLSAGRVREILKGIVLFLEPREPRAE